MAVDLLCTHVRLLYSTRWRYLVETSGTPDPLEGPQLAAVVDSISVVVHWENIHFVLVLVLVLVLVVCMYTREQPHPGPVLGCMREDKFVAVHIQLGLIGMRRTDALHKPGEWAGQDKVSVAAAAVVHIQRYLGRLRMRLRVLRVHSIA